MRLNVAHQRFRTSRPSNVATPAKIPEGGRIIDQVRDAVSSSDSLIVYLTRNSIGSGWVDKELEQVSRNLSLLQM